MNTNGNTYTIIYASIMVIIVAFLLAFVSSALKPVQDRNLELDKKKQILAALNIRGLDNTEIESKYDEVVIADKIIKSDGTIVNEGENKDEAGFRVDNKEITDAKLPLYVCMVNGEMKYVVPMSGRGLWGTLWGYIAINNDLRTVYGAFFSHESETAGLGSPIAEQKFQDTFIGKHIFADGDTKHTALTVVKKGKVEPGKEDFQVDGLTGATLTSNGVAAMVNEGLQQYNGFFNMNK